LVEFRVPSFGDEELPMEEHAGQYMVPLATVSERIDPGPPRPERLADGLVDPAGKPLAPGSPEARRLLADARAINHELLLHLQRFPDELRKISPRKFEEVLAEIFAARGYDVQLTAATRDGGYDLCVATHTDFGSGLYLVEAKRWRRLVGVPVVRTLYGEVEHHRANAGLVVTTSDFTPPAIQLASELRFRMSLHNYDALLKWLAEYRPNGRVASALTGTGQV
jgi:restriction system protein